MRKISKTLALMSLLAPFGANGLGIGDIRLHSALNQSLNAEIPLVASGNDELTGIRVTLASPEAFARAGIDRHYELSKLRFTPQQKADGSYVIKVSSKEAIREPFLNFMIEVFWPQGRLQREFTLLLDPPASFRETTIAETDLPETEFDQRSYEPVVKRVRPPEPVQEKPRRPFRESRVSAPPPTSTAETRVSGTSYGPIYKNETLWSIARRFNKDPSISQEQMLVAIYKANPRAFYKNSMDALKAGETITIPDRAAIVRLAGAAAPAAQPAINAGRLTAKADKQPEADVEPAGLQNKQGQLKLLAPSESISRGETATSGENVKAGKTREDIALEVADTVKQESEEIHKRLTDLEQKLSGMQKLLSLKDEQIAELQAQKQQAITEPPPAVATTQANVPPSAPPAQGMQAIPPVARLSEGAPATTPSQPVAKPPAPVKPVVPSAPVKEEEGFWAGLLDSSHILVGGVMGLLLLGAAGWLISRRRAAMIDETESILDLSDREKTIQVKRSSTRQVTPPSPSSMLEQSSSVRSSFLSEFTPSDFDALGGEMEEVDPISEADVYLAYGRYKQAEELIRNAIAHNPERDECKLKLLEIHYSTENAQAFEKFAKELATTHKETKAEFWEKVVDMGRELCPGNPLFREDKQPTLHSSRTETSSPLVTKAGDENLFFFHQEDEEPYGYPLSPMAESQQPESVEQATPATIAYDFFTTEPKKSALDKELEEDSINPQSDNIISFDKAQARPGVGIKEIPEKTLDDILAELGVHSDSYSLNRNTEGEQKKFGNDDGLEFHIGLDHEIEKPAGENLNFDEDSTGFLSLTEMDEQETKLDLAKAYIDMGDEEAARAILENVAEQGSDKQREEAWTLLKTVSRQGIGHRQ